MENWTADEIERLANTDDLHIAPFREDGATYGTLTWVWSVVVEGALFVRAYHGPASSWYKAALKQRAGRITAAGMTRDVCFARADDSGSKAIDDAYRAKYSKSPYLAPMIAAGARAATIAIKPRNKS